MSVLDSTVSDHILTIRLNRPEVFNSFNREMALALQADLEQATDDKDVRCIILTGKGKAFSAGQDLNEVVDPDGPEMRDIVSNHYNPIIGLLRGIEKPVIAAVNGVAAGAGANIALACDIVVAKSSAAFIQAFSKIGLIPDSGGTFVLPRLIGLQRASAITMLAEKITAEEAVAMGMIYKSVPDDDFDAYVQELATKLAQMPTRGLGLTKRALNASMHNDLQSQLALEEELQFMAGNTADYHEGVSAFLEKRKPVFKGE